MVSMSFNGFKNGYHTSVDNCYEAVKAREEHKNMHTPGGLELPVQQQCIVASESVRHCYCSEIREQHNFFIKIFG